MIKEVYSRFRNLILYGIIGGFCAALDFGVYSVLCYRDFMPYLWANIISIHIGIFTSFVLNRSFNYLSAVEVLGNPKVSNKQSRNPRCVYTNTHVYNKVHACV